MIQRTYKQALVSVGLLLAMLVATESNAQTAQNLAVSATVPSVCIIDVPGTSTTLPFDLSGLAAAVTDFTNIANFAWRCNSGTFNVSISTGGGTDATARAMSGPGGSLAYNLYTDNTYSTFWGDGGNGASAKSETGLGMNTVGTSVIYGRVLLTDAQNATVGAYTDTVVVTLLP